MLSNLNSLGFHLQDISAFFLWAKAHSPFQFEDMLRDWAPQQSPVFESYCQQHGKPQYYQLFLEETIERGLVMGFPDHAKSITDMKFYYFTEDFACHKRILNCIQLLSTGLTKILTWIELTQEWHHDLVVRNERESPLDFVKIEAMQIETSTQLARLIPELIRMAHTLDTVEIESIETFIPSLIQHIEATIFASNEVWNQRGTGTKFTLDPRRTPQHPAPRSLPHANKVPLTPQPRPSGTVRINQLHNTETHAWPPHASMFQRQLPKYPFDRKTVQKPETATQSLRNSKELLAPDSTQPRIATEASRKRLFSETVQKRGPDPETRVPPLKKQNFAGDSKPVDSKEGHDWQNTKGMTLPKRHNIEITPDPETPIRKQDLPSFGDFLSSL